MVGAHDALQDAMVCAYADSTGTSVLDKKSAKEMLDWREADPCARCRDTGIMTSASGSNLHSMRRSVCSPDIPTPRLSGKHCTLALGPLLRRRT
jgi:hypothetical protein